MKLTSRILLIIALFLGALGVWSQTPTAGPVTPTILQWLNSGSVVGSMRGFFKVNCVGILCSKSGNTITIGDTTSTFQTGTSGTLVAPSGYYICTSTCTITLPVPAAGYQFCVTNTDNVATVITLAALGSSARYENTARTAYGTASTGTLSSGGAAADKVCVLGLDSTHYLTITFNGTWTAS